MKTFRYIATVSTFLTILLASAIAADSKIAITGGTLINPGQSKVIENAVIIIEGDHVVAAGSAKEIAVPTGTKIVDAKGRWILPGYIDTHVHFFQSGDLFTRPDGVDLTKVRPYADEVAMIKRNLPDTLERYLRSGITSVAVAGPLISSVSRPQLDLGDPPIVKIDNPEQAREFVRKLAAQNPDLVKIWYIVDKDHPVDSFRPIVRATVEESHARKLPCTRPSWRRRAPRLQKAPTFLCTA